MKVLIVDDHALVRQGLRLILKGEAGIDVAGEAGTAREALELLKAGRPDVALFDINLPDRTGFDLLKDVRRLHPGLPVLFLSIHREEHFAIRALQAGANGYLNKECTPEELVAALRKLAAGGTYVSTALAELLARDVGGRRHQEPHELLSDREYQVMVMLAAGKAVAQIAQALNRSPNTISTFRARILQKMGMASNAELARYALDHQMIE